MHDTLKKPRELLAVAYAILFPDLAAKSKHLGGDVNLDTMDPAIVEADRQHLLAIEKLILETICFNLTAKMSFPYVIKLGKDLKASKKLVRFAWRIAIDCYCTLIPLMYPPHSIALGSIYVASLLLSFEQPQVPFREGETSSADLASMLNQHTEWEDKYETKAQDLDDIAHISRPLTPNRLLQTRRHPHHPLPPLISLETDNITSIFPTIRNPNPS